MFRLLSPVQWIQLVKLISWQTPLPATGAVPYRAHSPCLQDLAGVSLAAQTRVKGELRKKWESQTPRSNVLRTWPVLLLRVHQEALRLSTSEPHAKGGTEAGDGPDTGLVERNSGCKKAMFQRTVGGEGTERGASS